jgi:hypothetical protein
MSVSRIALLFLLAGVLLLRKPVFGQSVTVRTHTPIPSRSEKPVRPRTLFSDYGHL